MASCRRPRRHTPQYQGWSSLDCMRARSRLISAQTEWLLRTEAVETDNVNDSPKGTGCSDRLSGARQCGQPAHQNLDALRLPEVAESPFADSGLFGQEHPVVPQRTETQGRVRILILPIAHSISAQQSRTKGCLYCWFWSRQIINLWVLVCLASRQKSVTDHPVPCQLSSGIEREAIFQVKLGQQDGASKTGLRC